MIMKVVLGLVSALTATVLPAAAFAEGAVKVECFGHCDLSTLGQICDTYALGSQPVAIACDDTALGRGNNKPCGGIGCRPFGEISINDLLSDYCEDGPGYDAIVTCRVNPVPVSAPPSAKVLVSPKVDDGAVVPQND